MFVYDIESNGLLHNITKLHCLNAIDRDTGEELRYTDHEYYQDLAGNYTDVPCPRTGDLQAGLLRLSQAEVIAGHFILGYDEPALDIVYPKRPQPQGLKLDSRELGKLLYPKLKDIDKTRMRKGKLPSDFRAGSHSLFQWGQRLGGQSKSDFKPGNYTNPHTGKPHTWETIPFTRDMDEYCMQDVRANVTLIEHFEKKIDEGYATWPGVWMEMRTAELIRWQERIGVPFSTTACEQLVKNLYKRKYELEQECQRAFPPFYVKNDTKLTSPKKTIKYKDKLRPDLTAGAEYQKIKLVEFNPGSRAHITLCLKRKYDWHPTEFTETGLAKIDDEILGALPYPEAKVIAEYMMVQKRISQAAEGPQGWLRKAKAGRIYGSVDTLGTRTRRMTHYGPNLAQVPANDAPYGEQCRALFTAEEGRVLVGCDADALELRVLAHFMARFDGGAYIKTVLEGKKEDGTDMHTRNQKAIGLQFRPTAKTWFYAFIYGAGDLKLGSIVMSEWDVEKMNRFAARFPAGRARERKIMQMGKRSRDKFMASLPALAKLVDKVKKASKRGWIKGLDGGRVVSASQHSALNTLCQSAGALIMKQALIVMFDDFAKQGLDVRPLLNVHDEVQLSVKEEDAHVVGTIAADSIRKAGEHFNFRCPLAGDFDIGKTWAETH